MANTRELSIPRTKGRLSSSIKLRAGIDMDSTIPLLASISPQLASIVGNINNIKTLNAQLGPGGSANVIGHAANLATTGNNFRDIDGVLSFTRDQSRELEPRYSLGRDAFEPFQIVPTKIKTEITLRRVVFYDVTSPDLTNVFGFFPETLLFQQFPFVIQEEKYAPGDFSQSPETVGGGAQTTTVLNSRSDKKLVAVNLYLECWFMNNPVTYDIMDDNQLVMPEMKIRCGKMLSFDGTQQSNRRIFAEGIGAVAEGLTNTLSLLGTTDLSGRTNALGSLGVGNVKI